MSYSSIRTPEVCWAWGLCWALGSLLGACGVADATVAGPTEAAAGKAGVTIAGSVATPAAGSGGLAPTTTTTTTTPVTPATAGANGGAPASTTAGKSGGSAGATGMMSGAVGTTPSQAGSGNTVTPPTAGSPAGAAGSPTDPGTPTDGGCKPASYSLAARLSLNVSWDGTLGLVGGSDLVHFWSRIDVTKQGDAVQLVYRYCGSQLPVMTTTAVAGGHKVFQETPVTVFDANEIRSAPGTATAMGAGLSLQPGPLLVGVMLPDPRGTWPMSVDPASAMDVDADGSPGLTSFPKSGEGFGLSPTSIVMTNLADELYGVQRLVYTASVPDACAESLVGPAQVTFFNQSVVGCHRQGGADCGADEATFINDNRPTFKPGEATFTAKSIAAGASCSEVRASVAAMTTP